jgi:signal transduction histidine kinase
MIAFAIMLLRGTEEATIAFAVCVGVIAITIGVKGKNLLVAAAVGACMFLLRNFTMPSVSTLHQITSLSAASRVLSLVIFFLAMFMVAASASRKYRLKLFNNEFASLRTLAFEKSFQFDLDSWTNASAALFKANKAACIVQGPTPQASVQYHACNLPMLQKEQERLELLDALGRLQIGYKLFDTYLNRVFYLDTGHYRAFDENEQRIARVLRRADIREALVQPLQIDRMRGGFICAVNSRIDAIIMAEAAFLGRHVADMAAHLSKVANAQRNFIADAHEVARRDLHDGVLQTLAALRLRLLLLTKRADVAQKPIELEIRKAVDIVTLEQSRLRGFLESSNIAANTVDLVAQLDICARTVSLQWGVDVTLKSEEPAILVDVESSFNIEHLLREVITNAVRHAKSKCLTVTLSLKQGTLIMSVLDLSEPLEGPQMQKNPALTLKSASLRDRLKLLNADAYVEGLGKGTLLSIRIPMQQIEND